MQKRTRTRACAGYAVAPRVSAFHDDLGCLRAWDRPIQAFCTPIMIAPCTRRQRFIRTARRYRTIEIQAGPPIIVEALPDELRHAIETIVRAADLRTNLAQLGAAIRCCTAAFSASSSASWCADPRCPIARDPRREDHTTYTAVAPDVVFTVRMYGIWPLYRSRLVRKFSFP